jgi:hypothetical protein
MITGMTKHFMFHILWISILRFLYFNFFSAYFCIIFLPNGIATSINKQVLSFLFLIIIIVIIICSLFNDSARSSDYKHWVTGLSINSDLERIWKEAAVA